MSPSRPPPPAISAPGLIGPVSILNWPVAGPRAVRRHRRRPYTHVHLEIDLRPEALAPGTSAFVRRIERALREREVEESTDLLKLTAAVLHALSAVGFLRVFHWEVEPGGWLPLPDVGRARNETPLGQFLRALDSPSWQAAARARSLSLRLGARGDLHADAAVRLAHLLLFNYISLYLMLIFSVA